MKRLNYHYFLLGAIALAGAWTLTSCSSSDEETAEVNPTYDGKSVKTQFAINIGNVGDGDGTRMTAANTQNGTNFDFLGLYHIHLIPFKIQSGTLGSSSSYEKIISDLPNIVANGLVNGHKIFSDVSIPESTTDFLFYGLGYNARSSYDEKIAGGALTAVYEPTSKTSTPADFSFSLVALDEDDNKTAIETALSGIMTDIANAKVTKNYTETSSSSNKTATFKWSDTDASKDLGKFYREFIGTSDNSSFTPLAGSATAVLATVSKLYSKVNAYIADNTVLGGDDAATKNPASITRSELATAIEQIIANAAPSGSSNKYFTITKNEDNTIVMAWNSDALTGNLANLASFPSQLPAGAVQYQWNSTNSAFAYGVTTIGTTTNNISVKSLTYPASLAYFCNTLAFGNDEDVSTWPASAAAWQNGTDSYWSSDKKWYQGVKNTTSTIALRDNVNYGVADLATTVKLSYESGHEGYLSDNTSGTTVYRKIADNGLKVTGILIGGQPSSVDWQFLPVSGYTEKTVYDKWDTYATTTAQTTPNYTLLLDNYSTENSPKKVKIAVEFENNIGADFEGADGVVAQSQKFYLIGEIDPSKVSSESLFSKIPTDYRYPGSGTNRAFLQDFTTTSNLTVSSLKNAYCVIPDLRTTNMILGLSVNLEWQTGLTYDVTLGN